MEQFEYDKETGLVTDSKGFGVAALTRPRRDELGPKMAAANVLHDACLAAREALLDYLEGEEDETFREVFNLLDSAIIKAGGETALPHCQCGERGDLVSTMCGSFCPQCLTKHQEECEVCRNDSYLQGKGV